MSEEKITLEQLDKAIGGEYRRDKRMCNEGCMKYFASFSRGHVERFAKELHEAGRQAFLSGATVAQQHHDDKVFPFIEWEDLSESAKDGKRIQARYLINKFNIELMPPDVKE
ncbi:MAG: hypothetical protein RRY12_01685 [Cloacibacillus sp.]